MKSFAATSKERLVKVISEICSAGATNSGAPLIAIAFILVISCYCYADPSASELEAIHSIEITRVKSHVDFLANDLLEGREAGSHGYDIAALYVATQFVQLGLEPAGKNGTFLQPVPLRRATVVPQESSLTLLRHATQHSGGRASVPAGSDADDNAAGRGARPPEFGKEGKEERLQNETHYVMSDDYLRTSSSVTAEAIFAGFGVTAPELKYDNYAGLDVKNKIVVLLSGAPATFPASQRAHYSSSYIKEKNAVAHGAIGILTVRTPVDEKRQSWDRIVRQSKLSGFRWLDKQGQPNKVFPEIQGTALMHRSAAEKLFAGARQTLNEVFESIDQNAIQTFPLGLSVNIKKITRHESTEDPNVVAVFRGSDPKLQKQYVVYTAHLDHIGITDPIDGDRINNGAYDNATGIAALIEIARAFTLLPVKPKRSILFVAVAAEEKGLQGSDYYANFPTVPAEAIVANVNMDMLLMLYPIKDVVILGEEHSSLGPIARKVAQDLGCEVSPDPAPEEVRFIRSDQYSFIRKGIPAVKFLTGFQSTDPKINGEEVTKKWLQTIYHSPQDESSQKMDWESGRKIIAMHFLTGYRVAQSAQRPHWNKGDFFATLYASGR